MIKSQWLDTYSDLIRMEEKIFFNSTASLNSIFPSPYSSEFNVSVSRINLNQYADSFDSFLEIFILILKSFLPKHSLASI